MAKLTPEGRVKASIRALLAAQGITYIKTPTTAGYGTSGDFDIRCVYKGMSIGIEAKATPQDLPTMLQTKNALDHYEAGGISVLVHDSNLMAFASVLKLIETGALDQPIINWPANALAAYQRHKESSDATIEITG